MNRIDRRFEDLSQRTTTALIPYVCAGHPSADSTVEVLHALVDSGADLLELGVPFSDPMADGPVIQAAAEKALEQGVGLDDVLAMVERFRTRDSATPLILMGYLNPLLRYGLQRFSADASSAGVDGLLIVDAPPEESGPLRHEFSRHDLHQIFLVAPTTSEDRARMICEIAGGFVYYVSLKGVTGADSLSADQVKESLDGLRRITDLPIGVGFGIKNADDARRIGVHADAVVIGSALVQALDQADDSADAIARARTFLTPVREALNGVAQKG